LRGAWRAAGNRTRAIASVGSYYNTDAHKHKEPDKNDKKGALVRLHWPRIPTAILIRNRQVDLWK